MGTRFLYTCAIRENALQRRSGQANQRQEVAKLTGLSGDGTVTEVGAQPGEFSLEGQYHGIGAEMLATSISELAASSAIGSVPFFDADTEIAAAGYYSVEQIQNRRFRPQRDEVADFNVSLAREGTIDSHRRQVFTNTRQVTHDWGSDATEEIGISNTATKIKWVAEDKSANTPATSTGTRESELGTIALFDPTDAPTSYESPRLSYRIPYADEGDVDCRVYDERGLSEFVDGDFRWQQVFQASHEFTGNVVLENGVVRLIVDESANSLSVEEWDSGTSAWTTRSLNAANGWQVVDADLVDAGPARVYAQFEFEDADDGSRYTLDAFLHRGWQNVQFAIPQGGSGPVPDDLETYLDPVASPRYTDAREDKRLLDREVLRQ